MTSPTGLHHHHNADELLEDYLLGTLSAEETAWMQAHLETCPQCQAEVEPLLGSVQALPFGAPEPDVSISDDLWDRIEGSLSTSRDGSEPSGAAVPDPPTSTLRSLPLAPKHHRAWLIAALMLVSLLSGAMLSQAVPQFIDDEGHDEQVIAIEFTDPDITASGQLRYLSDEQVFVLEVTGLPELSEGEVYQAWLFQQDVPIPVGVMNAGTESFAAAGDRDNLELFCVTVEQGPLGSPAPTSDPILVASLQGSDPS